MSKKYFTQTTKKVADETTWRKSIMESIARSLSLPLPIRRCRKCKEYKTTMANLLQIIQKQNEQLQNLQRQLHFTKAQYLEQNQRLSRTQEKILCNACLVKFKQPNKGFELCSSCSTRVPNWTQSSRLQQKKLGNLINLNNQSKTICRKKWLLKDLGGSATHAAIINHRCNASTTCKLY